MSELTRARARIKDMEREFAEVETENEELSEIFEMARLRTQKATELMRAAGDCEPDVYPDLGRVLGWLLRRIDTRDRELEGLRESGKFVKRFCEWMDLNDDTPGLRRVRDGSFIASHARKALTTLTPRAEEKGDGESGG